MITRWVAACALGCAALGSCASTQDEVHFRADRGWSLCGGSLPVDMISYVPEIASTQSAADAWTEEQRTNIAGTIALAFALRCDESATVAERARGYRGITAINNPNANQVNVYPDPGSANLIVDLPDYADYRGGRVLADLRHGITCGLAPNEIPNSDDCLAD